MTKRRPLGLAAAKRLFFAFEGSSFYMWKEGVEERYLQASVPRETELTWLEELTRLKLRELDSSGNYQTIRFLRNHSDFRHTQLLLDTEPKGQLWEKTAYLEGLLGYLRDRADSLRVPIASESDFQRVLDHAQKLLRRARSDERKLRIGEIIGGVNTLLGCRGV